MASRRYLPALLVLLLPLVMVLLVRGVSLIVLPKAFTTELKVHCFVQTLPNAEPPFADCKDAIPANDGSPGTRPEARGSASTPQAKDASGGSTPSREAAQKDAASASAPPASRAKARSLPQLRALEGKARTSFAVASAMLVAIALGGLIFAITQTGWSWCRRELAGPPPVADLLYDRSFVFGTMAVMIVLALVMLYFDTASDNYDNFLINLVLAAGVRSKALGASSADAFQGMIKFNLAVAYVAAGFLLVYLASLAIPSTATGNRKDRLAAFQFIIAIGGAILAFSAFANQAALGWVSVAVDEATGAALLEGLKAIPDLWSVASSVFLFTAIATGYFAITANNAGGNAPAAGATSALDLRTPTGDDFKALGWIVQFVIALAPIWLPSALGKILELSSKLPGP